MSVEPHELRDLAIEAAHAAGRELLQRAALPARDVRSKSSATDLVSAADDAADAIIVAAIRAQRPDDAVLTEESGGATEARGIRWVIDPLDGTVNFLWGIPHWAVSIAAVDAEGGLVGVVHHPSAGETFVAVRGEGATLNGAPITVNDAHDPREAMVATGFSYRVEERSRQAQRIPTLVPQVRDIRRFGAAALDLAWVACGRLDAYFERGVEEWDWRAGGLIAHEAGAHVENWAPVGERPAGILACAPALADAVRELAEGT